ncbi:MAG: hypothetical protein K8R60_04600 [Burkholderiales bacterium]|nr:hypothetical protein [Burkholderiales bacterium]
MATKGVWAADLCYASDAPECSPGAAKVVHQSRGQLCGQLDRIALQPEPWRIAEEIAETLSRIKVFEINMLHRSGAGLRGISPRQASIGAAVELSARAGAGFADE